MYYTYIYVQTNTWYTKVCVLLSLLSCMFVVERGEERAWITQEDGWAVEFLHPSVGHDQDTVTVEHRFNPT